MHKARGLGTPVFDERMDEIYSHGWYTTKTAADEHWSRLANENQVVNKETKRNRRGIAKPELSSITEEEGRAPKAIRISTSVNGLPPGYPHSRLPPQRGPLLSLFLPGIGERVVFARFPRRPRAHRQLHALPHGDGLVSSPAAPRWLPIVKTLPRRVLITDEARPTLIVMLLPARSQQTPTLIPFPFLLVIIHVVERRHRLP